MSDPRAALDAIGKLPDTEIDIADAALQAARLDAPAADWLAARGVLSAIARAAVERAGGVPADDVAGRAAMLAQLLAGEFGFEGDIDTYDDLANANLIHVIERRRGLPVALGIVWLHAAHAAGWSAHGVNFPGHFMIALAGKGRQMVIDSFAGGMKREAPELRSLLKRVEGEGAELRPGVLAPMSARAVLLRLQDNIRTRRLQAGDIEGALTCAEDMLRFAPDEASLWREAALMNKRLDRVGAALRCFDRFLVLVPEGAAAARVRGLVEDLRSRLNCQCRADKRSAIRHLDCRNQAGG
jgi:regulator of sirC expression with transglutaminase-like and TPR domain